MIRQVYSANDLRVAFEAYRVAGEQAQQRAYEAAHREIRSPELPIRDAAEATWFGRLRHMLVTDKVAAASRLRL